MRGRLGERLTYANVMSTLAAFLALAGGSFAIGAALSKNSVKSKQVKNESLTDKDLKDNRAVGSAEIVDESVGAGDLASGAVGSAEIASGAVGAAQIANGSVGAAKLAPDEAAHVVGDSTEPQFGTGGQNDCVWSDFRALLPTLGPVSFYRDKNGRVHLSGNAVSNNGPGGDAVCDNAPAGESLEDNHIFTLPPGYRPANVILTPASDGAANVNLLIGPAQDSQLGASPVAAGMVTIFGDPGPYDSGLQLDGISFRAAG